MLPRMEAWEEIEGAKEFAKWFGGWPSFHDAELQHIHFNSDGPTSLLVYAFAMLNETDEKGYYKCTKHVMVEFSLFGIDKVEIEGQDCYAGNILMSLGCTKNAESLQLEWSATLGLGALLTAKSIALKFTPLEGPPPTR